MTIHTKIQTAGFSDKLGSMWQHWTCDYEQLRNSESGRNNLPQGGAHYLTIQY